jgi:hypothetical protein
MVVKTKGRLMNKNPNSVDGSDRLLSSLSVRARKHLLALGQKTDQEVRDHVAEQGALSLLRSPNMYRKSYLEICDTFGFDPKSDAPEPPASRETEKPLSEPSSDPEPGF